MSETTAIVVTITAIVAIVGLALALWAVANVGPNGVARAARRKQRLAGPAAQAAAQALGGTFTPLFGAATWPRVPHNSRERFIEEAAAAGIGLPLTADPFPCATAPSLLNLVRADRSFGSVAAYQFHAHVPCEWSTYHRGLTVTKTGLNCLVFVADFHVNPLLGVQAEAAIAQLEATMRRLAKHRWNEPARVEAGNHVMLAVTHPNREVMAEYYDALAVLAPGEAA